MVSALLTQALLDFKYLSKGFRFTDDYIVIPDALDLFYYLGNREEKKKIMRLHSNMWFQYLETKIDKISLLLANLEKSFALPEDELKTFSSIQDQFETIKRKSKFEVENEYSANLREMKKIYASADKLYVTLNKNFDMWAKKGKRDFLYKIFSWFFGTTGAVFFIVYSLIHRTLIDSTNLYLTSYSLSFPDIGYHILMVVVWIILEFVLYKILLFSLTYKKKESIF